MCVGGVKLGPIMAAVGTDTSIEKEQQQKKVGGMLYKRIYKSKYKNWM